MLQKRQQGFLIKFSWLPAVSAIKCMGCSQGDSQGNRIASHNGLFGRDITFAPFCLFSSHSALSHLPTPGLPSTSFSAVAAFVVNMKESYQCKKRSRAKKEEGGEKPPPSARIAPARFTTGRPTKSGGCDKKKKKKQNYLSTKVLKLKKNKSTHYAQK